jgi:hypothetical protein
MSKGLGYEGRLRYTNRCRAHRQRDGKPCGAWAMRGTTVCRVHGGMAPQVRAKAAERQASMTNYIANALIDAMDRAGVLRDGRGLPAPWGERLLVALGIIDGHYLEPEPPGATPPREAHAYRPSGAVDAAEQTDRPEPPVGESATSTAPIPPSPRPLNQDEAAALMRESRLRSSAVRRKGLNRHTRRLR